jgi:hypothetical protein
MLLKKGRVGSPLATETWKCGGSKKKTMTKKKKKKRSEKCARMREWKRDADCARANAAAEQGGGAQKRVLLSAVLVFSQLCWR